MQITKEQILTVYKEIQHKSRMLEIVKTKRLRDQYSAERLAMWEVLQIMYGHDCISQTIDAVFDLAKTMEEEEVA